MLSCGMFVVYFFSGLFCDVVSAISVMRTANAPTETRTENLPNTSAECYRYTSLLGSPV
jgi:hypothetical protein